MKCLNRVFKVLPYDTDMVAGWFYIRLWFRDNLWTSTSRTYVEQSCTIFQFHRKIYWPLYSLGSEKLILWARLCCNSDRRCGSVSSCAYQCRSVFGGAQRAVSAMVISWASWQWQYILGSSLTSERAQLWERCGH